VSFLHTNIRKEKKKPYGGHMVLLTKKNHLKREYLDQSQGKQKLKITKARTEYRKSKLRNVSTPKLLP